MKTLLTALFALSALVVPAAAQTISDVDHPDIPNCVMFPKSGHNALNCENLTIQAVYAHNGAGTKVTYKDAYGGRHSFYTW